MAKRSLNFKNVKQNLSVDRDTLDRKRAEAKRIITEKRDTLKRDAAAGSGRALAVARTHKLAVAGVAALGAAAVAATLVPDHSGAAADHSAPAAYSAGASQAKDTHASVTSLGAAADQQNRLAAEKTASLKAATEAKADAGAAHSAKQAATRSAPRQVVYPDTLDGWIRESLAVMKAHNIPGSYNGLYRNIIRESSGNPMAINNWDINAINGVPSKGLLQVIPPTFSTYHVAGTSWNIYDPVANITAAANYAADRYGSMDNVNSAY
jgi:Transglycosylase SLT domain